MNSVPKPALGQNNSILIKIGSVCIKNTRSYAVKYAYKKQRDVKTSLCS